MSNNPYDNVDLNSWYKQWVGNKASNSVPQVRGNIVPYRQQQQQDWTNKWKDNAPTTRGAYNWYGTKPYGTEQEMRDYFGALISGTGSSDYFENGHGFRGVILPRFNPGYVPTYWEDPYKVARYYNALQANPQAQLPEWVDPKKIQSAYEYFDYVNGGKPWQEWGYLPPDDPARSFLGGMNQPPLPGKAGGGGWGVSGQGVVQPYDPETGRKERAAAQAEYEALPNWQKFMISMMSNPASGGAVQMGAMGAIGGAFAGGPLGALVGGVGGGVLGGALGFMQDPWITERLNQSPEAIKELGLGMQSTAAELLNWMDYPAEWLEKGAGVGLQLGMAAYDPKTYGSVESILNNLPAAWDAATLTATTGALGDVLGFEGEIPMGLGKTTDMSGWNVQNIPAVIGALIRAGTPEVTLREAFAPENFAQRGQTWILGQAAPVDVDVANGMMALVQARQEIVRGGDPVEIVNRFTDMYGYSGVWREMIGHMAFDPLNFLPHVESGVGAAISKIAGADELAKSFTATLQAHNPGLKNAFEMHRTRVLTGLAGTVDELTAVDKWVAGLNSEGQIRNLTPSPSPKGGEGSAVKRAISYLTTMTPESRAREMLGVVAENAGALMELAGDDPAKMVELLKGWQNLKPTEAAQVASFLGAPEAYTARQVLAGYMETANEMGVHWEATAGNRELLLRVAELTGENAGGLIERLNVDSRTQNGVSSLDVEYQRLVDMARASESPSAKALIESVDDGSFTAAALGEMVKVFGGDEGAAWHPREFQARLVSGLIESAAKWGVEAFGVKKPGAVFRVAGALKSAQSLVLLGFNPAYAINNAVNNVVTRAAAGVFGFAGEGTVTRFLDRFGVTPYRLGDIGQASEMGARVSGAAGEAAIGAALRGDKVDVLDTVKDKLGAVGAFAPMSAISGKIEASESRNAFYFGMKQGWNALWSRGKGFGTMPSALVSALEGIDPRLPGVIYGAVEAGLNMKEVREALMGSTMTFRPEAYVHDVAGDLGMDVTQVREVLRPVMDGLAEELSNVERRAQNEGGASDQQLISNAFSRARRKIEDHIGELNARELVTRVQDVANQVDAGGLAEVVRAYDEVQLQTAEFWQREFDHWRETFAKADQLESGPAKSALFAARQAEAARGWGRTRKFQRATFLGIFESLGIESDAGRGYIGKLDELGKVWDDFFAEKNQDLRDFFSQEYADYKARAMAWDMMQVKHHEMYVDANFAEGKVRTAMDDLFVQGVGVRFPEAERQAKAWRSKLADLNFERTTLMEQFRQKLMGQPVEVTRREWPIFLEKEYLPLIREYFQNEVMSVHDMFKALAGETGNVERRAQNAGDAVVPRVTGDMDGMGPGQLGGDLTPSPSPKSGEGGGVDVAQAEALRAQAEAARVKAEEAAKVEAERIRVETEKRAKVAEVSRVASEGGVPLVDDAGRAVPGATRHLLNVVKKYGGEAAQGVRYLEDINPEVLQAALAERVRVDAAQAAVRVDITPEEGRAMQVEAYGEEAVRGLEAREVARRTVTQTPRGELDPLVSNSILAEAELMLDELASGEFMGHVREMGQGSGYQSSNVAWYGKMVAEGLSSRETVENALRRIIRDGGDDKVDLKYVTYLKDLIFQRIASGESTIVHPYELYGALGLETPGTFAVRVFDELQDVPAQTGAVRGWGGQVEEGTVWKQVGIEGEWKKVGDVVQTRAKRYKGSSEMTVPEVGWIERVGQDARNEAFVEVGFADGRVERMSVRELRRVEVTEELMRTVEGWRGSVERRTQNEGGVGTDVLSLLEGEDGAGMFSGSALREVVVEMVGRGVDEGVLPTWLGEMLRDPDAYGFTVDDVRGLVKDVGETRLFQRATMKGAKSAPSTLPGFGEEAMPLFSGTAMRGQESVYKPVEVARPGVLPGFESTVRPGMKGAKAGGGEVGGPLFEQKREPLVMTFDEYANSKGAPFMGGAEPALHKNRPRSDRAHAENVSRMMDAMRDNNELRDRLRGEYADKVASGEIREPTQIEQLAKTAEGHPDNESVQAARRLLSKRFERVPALREQYPDIYKRWGTGQDTGPARARIRAELEGLAGKVKGLDVAHVEAAGLLLDARAEMAVRSGQVGSVEEWYATRLKGVEVGQTLTTKGTKDAKVIQGSLFQGGAKGMAEFMADGRAVITAFEGADVSTLVHEIGHVFRRDLGVEDLAIAEKWAKVEGGRWDVKAEEKFARGFERWMAEGVAPSKGLAKVFEQLKGWLLNVYRKIVGSPIDVELGPEIRGVFGRLLAEEAQGKLPGVRDQVSGGTQGSLFQQAEPEGSAAFRDWFGESQVVDGEGKPLVVYHGTGADFEAFDVTKAGSATDSGYFGQGLYFTPDANIANQYAINYTGAGENIMPVYLQVKNPYDFRRDPLGVTYLNGKTTEGAKAIRETLMAAGYDGVIVKNDRVFYNGASDDFIRQLVQDGQDYRKSYYRVDQQLIDNTRRALDEGMYRVTEFMDAFGPKHTDFAIEHKRRSLDEIVVFNPEQVKSKFNRGTWDANDPRILYQGDKLDVGPVEPGVLEQVAPVEYASLHEGDGWGQAVRPVLDALESRMMGGMGNVDRRTQNGADGGVLGGLDPVSRGQVEGWLKRVEGEMATSKLGALRWGEMKRDDALLNYNRRYGFDQMLNLVYPYQFWYTRSLAKWAMRAIERPAWFANYARIKNYQHRMAQVGFPTRLRGKMNIPMPFLPEWMGGGTWVDPFAKLFPFADMLRPLDQAMADRSQEVRRAERIVQEWAEAGTLNGSAAEQAISSQAGTDWARAVAQARAELGSETGDPLSFVNLMMGKALYIDIPTKLLTGKVNEISVLPFTKTGQALRTVGRWTSIPVLSGLMQGLGGAMAAPEEGLRKRFDLSEFGEWGDYYIDRELANLAAEGKYTARQVQLAMIERSGEIFDEAKGRVGLAQAMGTPGVAPLLAGASALGMGGPGFKKATGQEVLAATLTGWLPSGLLPAGELAARGLKSEYDRAWSAYNAGDKTALNNFFEAYPEYEARLALWDKPEERLRQFLVSGVWEQYMALGKENQKLVRGQLGPIFEDAFVNKETRSYESIPVEVLATWVQLLGGVVPKTSPPAPLPSTGEGGQTLDVLAQQQAVMGTEGWSWPGGELGLIGPQLEQAVADYKEARNVEFPNWYALQSRYFEIPEENRSARRAFLARFPMLKEYWGWKAEYMAAHGEVANYLEQSTAGDRGSETVNMNALPPGLVRQVMAWSYGGTPLSPGAVKALRQAWESQGRPGGSVDGFLGLIVGGAGK